MLDLLLESALRSLALGVAVGLGLALLRVRNPQTQMTAWTVVLVASLAMPALMHRLTVTIPAAAPPLRMVESLSSRLSAPRSEPVEMPAVPTPGPLALPPATERSAMPPREALILLGACNHPWLLDTAAEQLADLVASRLRLANLAPA